jgi:3-phenylpropionate/trans-cinnamate dioxygenase ferredoxin component
MSEWIDVGPEGEIAPGAWRLVDVDGTDVAVFNVDGAYYAIEDVCTHDGAPLDQGEIEGKCIVCPRHGATFDVTTGTALTLPAVVPVATFPVRVVDGTIVIDVGT